MRVLDCNGGGSYAGVIAGVNYVTQQKKLAPWIPAVANMSLGGPADQSLDDAVRDSIVAGVTYTIAAGNKGLDACNFSPARVETAITVGATAVNDKRANFPTWASNIGSCVSLFAPGADITSTWNSSTTAIASLSGTSMATPHVAGVAALYLQSNPTAAPADVKSVILGKATLDVVTDIGFNSPNLLLYSLIPYYKNYSLKYQANVALLYWLNPVFSTMVAGTTGENRQMEALKIYKPSGVSVSYRAHVANLGWMPWTTAGYGGIAGTVGYGRQMEAAEIKLISAPSPDCKVRYRAHVADLGWLPWVEDGKTAGTTGQARRMEAIQMVCTCP